MKLNNFLFQYRKILHIKTGEYPASLFLKKHIKTKIDLIVPITTNFVLDNQDARNSKYSKPIRMWLYEFIPETKKKKVKKKSETTCMTSVLSGGKLWRLVFKIINIASNALEQVQNSTLSYTS